MAKIVFVAHPPERAAGKGRPLLSVGCSCCCCCCLHTLGGVAGSLIGGRAPRPLLDENGAPADSSTAADSAAVLTPTPSVPGLYWKTVGVFGLVALVTGYGVYGLIVLAAFLPVAQLLASGIVAILIRDQPAAAWRQLGLMTGLGFLGACLGGLLMYAMYAMVS